MVARELQENNDKLKTEERVEMFIESDANLMPGHATVTRIYNNNK